MVGLRLITVLILLPLLLGCSRSLSMQSSQKPPPIERLELKKVVINSIPLAAVDHRANDANFGDWLRRAATTKIEEIIRRENIAKVIGVEPADFGTSPYASVRIDVAMPVSLPPEVIGSRAALQKGTLARSTIQILKDGEVVYSNEASINWNDVRWTTGGHRMRRRRPQEQVLLDAVNEVVTRVVRMFAKDLHLFTQ